MHVRFMFLSCCMGALILSRAAAETIPGPVPAEEVLSVQDGDTLTVRARIWPGMTVETAVRIAGLDAPELRAKCERERAAALQAKARLQALARAGVALYDIRFGKYAGRVVARVVLPDGRDAAKTLIAEGAARPYDGGRRTGWCHDE